MATVFQASSGHWTDHIINHSPRHSSFIRRRCSLPMLTQIYKALVRSRIVFCIGFGFTASKILWEFLEVLFNKQYLGEKSSDIYLIISCNNITI